MCVERRKQPRVYYQVDASIANDEKWQQAQCTNISMSGMLLISDSQLPIGDRKKIKINQEYAEETLSIHADVEIVRVEALEGQEGFYEIGVKFTNLEPGASIDLLNLVRYHSGEGRESPLRDCQCGREQ